MGAPKQGCPYLEGVSTCPASEVPFMQTISSCFHSSQANSGGENKYSFCYRRMPPSSTCKSLATQMRDDEEGLAWSTIFLELFCPLTKMVVLVTIWVSSEVSVAFPGSVLFSKDPSVQQDKSLLYSQSRQGNCSRKNLTFLSRWAPAFLCLFMVTSTVTMAYRMLCSFRTTFYFFLWRALRKKKCYIPWDIKPSLNG